MEFDLSQLVRSNILLHSVNFQTKEKIHGEGKILLNANENSLGSPLLKWYHRYPDPDQEKLKSALSAVKGIPIDQLFLGNGSDECIDLLFRIFCSPGKDNCILCPPVDERYEWMASIHEVEVLKAPLLPNFQLNLAHIESLVNDRTKLIWICSPNNPTGNLINRQDIEFILNHFNGMVVVDEAYVNFSRQHSFSKDLLDYPNLVVIQTLSKAWGLAGLRIGIALASKELIDLMNCVKPAHNISQPNQELALKALEDLGQVNDMTRLMVDMREALSEMFQSMPTVSCVYPSDANFFMIKIDSAKELYEFLLGEGILVKDLSSVAHCEDCLRITVGTEAENTSLVDAMAKWFQEKMTV